MFVGMSLSLSGIIAVVSKTWEVEGDRACRLVEACLMTDYIGQLDVYGVDFYKGITLHLFSLEITISLSAHPAGVDAVTTTP